MNDRADRSGRSLQPATTHLVGVGPEREFSVARQLTSAPVVWLCSVDGLADFYDHPRPEPVIILLDGDLPPDDLIGLLDQFAVFLSAQPIIIQATNPAIRLVVTIMQRGVLDVLPKPYTLARLNAALGEILAKPPRRLHRREP